LEKGRLLDRMGRPGEAFAAFVEGKRLVGSSAARPIWPITLRAWPAG